MVTVKTLGKKAQNVKEMVSFLLDADISCESDNDKKWYTFVYYVDDHTTFIKTITFKRMIVHSEMTTCLYIADYFKNEIEKHKRYSD